MSEDYAMEENFYRMIAGMVTDILFHYDIRADRMMNSRCKNGVFGRKNYINNPTEALLKYVYPGDREFFLKFMKELKEGKNEVYVELRAKRVNGEYAWLVFEGKTICRYGIPEAVIGRGKIMADRNAEENRVYQMDERDMLTKVMKRSCINELLGLHFKSQPAEKAALMVLDLDDFAIINASMGHLFGDEVLVNVAGTIAAQISVGDMLGRVGGDKFLICIKNIEDKAAAQHKAEQIQQALRTLYIGEHQVKPLSASIGIALYPENGTEYSELYDQAVNALYFAKLNGKNRYWFGEREKPIEQPEDELLSERPGDDQAEGNEKAEFDKFGYELAEMAFRLMEEDVDVESVINLMIHKVADHYDLSAVSIREITNRPNTTKVSYEYLRKDYSVSDLGKDKYMSDEQWDLFVHKYRNGYYLYEKSEKDENDSVAKYKTSGELQTLLQIPLYRNTHFHGVIDCCDAYKKRKWSRMEIATLKMFARLVSGYLLNMQEYRGATAVVEQLKERDDVTGLYRYDTFLKKLQEYIEEGHAKEVVLIHSDIHHYKNANENYEYEISNRLLKSFSDAMLKESEKYSFLFGSRMHSDNIIAVLKWTKDDTVEDLLQQVRKFNQNFVSSIQTRLVQSGIKVNSGIYFLRNGDTAQHAATNVNLARKTAKENSDGIPVVFSEALLEKTNRQTQLIALLPEAIANKELVVYFQPKVECGTGRLVGAEALVRWKKKNGGFYFPDEFIPLFEKNGRIVDVDYHVYRETFSWLRQRLDEGKAVVPVSMNVSRIHLMDDALLHYIDELLAEYRIPPELLEFELTENIYISNMESALNFIEELRNRGLKVSMDDFGSGYSSLNMLNQLPIDVLKLDRVFLAKGELGEGDKIILSCVVEMAKKLRIIALCEGVETKEQSEFLNLIGCDVMQGYYYGKPMPMTDFEAFMENGK